MRIADSKQLCLDVEFLAGLQPPRSWKNLDSLKKAEEYIRKEFQKAGLLTGLQKWEARGNEYKNVLATYQPKKKKRLILGAHYDVYHELPGADDNASGVAGLLESARIIARLQPDIDYGIDFVAYCLEEPPFFGKKEMGSYIHAKSLFDHQVDLIGMICYEMIGYYAGKDTKRHFPPGVETDFPKISKKFIGSISTRKFSEFNRDFFKKMKAENPDRVGLIIFPDDVRGPSLSDNRNYWHFGYNALMLNDGPSGRNPNYHQPTDTPDTLNYKVMAEVVTAVTAACLKY